LEEAKIRQGLECQKKKQKMKKKRLPVLMTDKRSEPSATEFTGF
jgi:hypothetical protein